MKLKIYALKNTYLNVFDVPTFQNVEPDDIAEGYRRSILTNPDEAFKHQAHEKALYYLGYFDDVLGTVEPVEPQKLVDLAALFPRGYIAAHTAPEVTNG